MTDLFWEIFYRVWINKEYITGSGIALANNEIKDIMKVIRSLENRGNLLKGTTRRIACEEGGF